MEGSHHRFEVRATLDDVERGLETIHRSVEQLRRALGRKPDDPALMFFETALGEIGNNALLHGHVSHEMPVDFLLRSDSETVVAWLVDRGSPLNGHWVRTMPAATSEAGRGLALARAMLDSLDYERVGRLNLWRLVKSL